MKIIIAGSRHCNNWDLLNTVIFRALNSVFEGRRITEVVSGGARGVDRLGELYSQDQNLELKVFPADWQQYGKAAGPIRNMQMAKYADGLIAIMFNESRGTQNMVNTMKKLGKPYYLHEVKE